MIFPQSNQVRGWSWRLIWFCRTGELWITNLWLVARRWQANRPLLSGWTGPLALMRRCALKCWHRYSLGWLGNMCVCCSSVCLHAPITTLLCWWSDWWCCTAFQPILEPLPSINNIFKNVLSRPMYWPNQQMVDTTEFYTLVLSMLHLSSLTQPTTSKPFL